MGAAQFDAGLAILTTSTLEVVDNLVEQEASSRACIWKVRWRSSPWNSAMSLSTLSMWILQATVAPMSKHEVLAERKALSADGLTSAAAPRKSVASTRVKVSLLQYCSAACSAATN